MNFSWKSPLTSQYVWIVAPIPKQTERNRKERRRKKKKKPNVSGVTFHFSSVTFRVSPVTCNLSLTPTATATNRPPASSPTKQSRLVCKYQKNGDIKFITQKKLNWQKHIKTSEGLPIP